MKKRISISLLSHFQNSSLTRSGAIAQHNAALKSCVLKLAVLFVLFFFAGLLFSCSRDNPVLLTSKIKNITKNEFYDWLESKKVKKESIRDSRKKKIKLLESMALEAFIMDKTKAEGIEKSRRFLVLKEQNREETLYKYFIITLREQSTYNETAIRTSYIFLSLNLYKKDPKDHTKKIKLENREVADRTAELLSKAKKITQRLDSGEGFEKLVGEFSEDSNRNSGGDSGYIVKEMMPVYFSEPAFGLEVGEYTKTPVITPKGIYIIKLTDKVDITEKNIDRIIENESQRNRVKDFLTRQYISNYMAELMSADDVAFLYKKDETYNNTDVLFRVGAREYTAADLEKEVENRSTRNDVERLYKKSNMPEKMKFDIAKRIFSGLLYTREAVALGIEKNPDYLKELKEKEINLIMSEYLGLQASKEIFLSDQEIMEAYEKEKNRKYSEKAKENGAVVNKPVPFEVVRDEIIEDLKKKQQYRRAQEWKKKILDDYDFAINEAALEGV